MVVVGGDHGSRENLARLLARAGYGIELAATGESVLARTSVPRAVVIDVDLPDMHGFELCAELRDRFGDLLPVLLVSHDTAGTRDRVPALLIGADDYFAAPVNGDELLARLRRLIRRLTAPATNGTAANRLSVRELDVLRRLAGGATAGEIAQQLVISQKTVASHLQRIMSKLAVHTRAHAVAEAYRLGFVGEVTAKISP